MKNSTALTLATIAFGLLLLAMLFAANLIIATHSNRPEAGCWGMLFVMAATLAGWFAQGRYSVAEACYEAVMELPEDQRGALASDYARFMRAGNLGRYASIAMAGTSALCFFLGGPL